jgi:hypothetical protein
VDTAERAAVRVADKRVRGVIPVVGDDLGTLTERVAERDGGFRFGAADFNAEGCRLAAVRVAGSARLTFFIDFPRFTD